MVVKNSPVSESPAIGETASTESESTPQQEMPPTKYAIMVGDGVGSGGEGSGRVSAETTVRRKRGRPRKSEISGTASRLSELPPKRQRGRPRDSGGIQFQTSIGGRGLQTAGGSFTPLVLELKAGEDLVAQISSLAKFPGAAIVLAASGALYSAVLAPGQADDSVKYDGHFEILSLTGSFIFSMVDGTPCKEGYLSAVLAAEDGRVFGGVVRGCLIAANPVRLVVGSFKQSIHNRFPKRRLGGASSSSNAGRDGLGSSKAAIPIRVVPSLDNNDSITTTPEMSDPRPIHGQAGLIDDAGNQIEIPSLRINSNQNNSDIRPRMSPETDIATGTPQIQKTKDESDNAC